MSRSLPHSIQAALILPNDGGAITLPMGAAGFILPLAIFTITLTSLRMGLGAAVARPAAGSLPAVTDDWVGEFGGSMGIRHTHHAALGDVWQTQSCSMPAVAVLLSSLVRGCCSPGTLSLLTRG